MARAEAGPTPSLDLRLIVLTDRALAAPREVREVVEAALEAGAPAIQLRDKAADAAALAQAARTLCALTRRHGALLFVNDRVDVALASGADGVHLGPDDLPVAAVRAKVPRDFLIGYSTDDPEAARRAVVDGASYIGCGTVYGTTTKADAGEVIGLARLDEVARSVPVPVVAVGGITPERAAEIARTRAAGIAVAGAVMRAPDPADAVRRLMAPFAARRPASDPTGRDPA
jgi:thiamine-phosphate pyrophosphorylase